MSSSVLPSDLGVRVSSSLPTALRVGIVQPVKRARPATSAAPLFAPTQGGPWWEGRGFPADQVAVYAIGWVRPEGGQYRSYRHDGVTFALPSPRSADFNNALRLAIEARRPVRFEGVTWTWKRAGAYERLHADGLPYGVAVAPAPADPPTSPPAPVPAPVVPPLAPPQPTTTGTPTTESPSAPQPQPTTTAPTPRTTSSSTAGPTTTASEPVDPFPTPSPFPAAQTGARSEDVPDVETADDGSTAPEPSPGAVAVVVALLGLFLFAQ